MIAILAASYLSLPGQTNNSLISIAVAIGLFFTLLKVPGILMQMVFYNSANGFIRHMGHQIMNVISTDNAASASRETAKNVAIKTPRKVVAA